MKITDYISKPSEALQAMIDGLANQSKRLDFVIDMGTYGSTNGKTCFGCAATCAIQQITDRTLTTKSIGVSNLSIRSKSTGIDKEDYSIFEDAINSARQGYLSDLFDYFKLEHDYDFDYRFDMVSDNWEEQIPKVEELINELKERGL